jgi:hypothetical protein
MMDQQKLEQKDRTTIKITDHWFIYQDDPWHNVESKAQTRSYNRAILDLVGGGEVSAEEIE